jgi:Tol biopolymer transport system component
MPAATTDRSSSAADPSGRPPRARPWHLVAWVVLAALLALVGPPAALANPPGTTQRVSVSSAGTAGDDFSVLAAISGDGRLVAFTSDADNLVVGDGNFDTDIFVHDRPTQTTVRSSVRSDGTETGVELGSLNAALSADGQVVAFESEGALVAEDGGFPVDVFVHDEQPSPTFVTNSDARPGTDP